MNHRMCGGWIKFFTVCIGKADHISCKFYDRKLHAKAETKEWNLMGSCILDGIDLTVDAAASETAWNQDTADIT